MCKTLEKICIERQTATMTSKEIVQDLLQRLPDDASLQDIAPRELDNGESVPIDQVEQELPSWIIK